MKTQQPPPIAAATAERWRRHAEQRDLDELATYEGTPTLSAVANICSAVGAFIGAYALIFLLGDLHLGFAHWWPMALILTLDLVVNATVRIALWRRRRRLGLTLARRRQRLRY